MRTNLPLTLLLLGSSICLGNGCGSVSGMNDGGAGGQGGGSSGGGGHGAAGGDTGHGGSSGGHSADAGLSCGDLASQYAAALPAAQRCEVGATGQCQQLVSSSLSPCFVNCMTYVNDSSTLNPIKQSWQDAGCNSTVVLCPAIACLAPTNNACVKADGGGGTCSSNGGVTSN